MPTIYLIRHSQASFGGEDYDVLSELGRRQAALLDAELAERGVDATRVLAGTLRRQLDTALACPRSARAEPELDSRWNEYDSAAVVTHHAPELPAAAPSAGIGAQPGMSSREFQQVLDAALRAWIAAGHGSPCAETWPAFEARVTSALRELAAALGRGESALVFTSGGVIAALAAALLEAPPEAFLALNRTAVNAGVSKVLVGGSGVHLLSYNEQGHLERVGSAMSFR